jgi:LCP family protein required for cell wall assembly
MEQRQRLTKSSIDGFIVPQKKRIQPVRPDAVIKHEPAKPTASHLPKAEPVQPLNSVERQPEFDKQHYPGNDNAAELPNQRVKRPKHKWTFKRKAWTSALAILLIGFTGGAWYGAKLISNVDKVFHGNVFSDVHALVSSTTLKGQNQGRVNILLAGDSSDDPGHQGADLTDSVMVLSIDTKNQTGFMLSVPRDLLVDVPGYGHEKINAANENSNFHEAGYPSGGMGQLEQVVQTDLGIPIDYYALINYGVFKDSVDAVGGIKVDIQSPDPRGIYDAYTHLKLPNGLNELDGQQALDLARARGDDSAGDISYGFPNSDFNRTQHQREMLIALSQKAKNIGVLANPIKVSQLFDSVGKNVQTDFDLQDILAMAKITKGVNLAQLQSLTYSYGGGKSLLTDYTSPDGQESLVPTEGVDSFGQLQQYYQQLTSNNPVVREAPSIVILNGSNTDGLAHKMSVTLSSEGFNVVGVTDASDEYPKSMIIDTTNGGKPASSNLLKTTLPSDTLDSKSDTTPVEATEAQGYTADFVIVLGEDTSTMQQP